MSGSTTQTLGNVQYPLLAQDPGPPVVPGGSTLLAVSARAPDAGTVTAVVAADVALACTLTSGANPDSATGTAVVLSVECAKGDAVTLAVTANSGPSRKLTAVVTFTPVTVIPGDLVVLGQIMSGGSGTSSSYLPVFNIAVRGADPSGTNDSTGAIQSAINAAAVFGGVVYSPAGTYLFTHLTTPNSAVQINFQGAGEKATVWKCTALNTGTQAVGIFCNSVMSDMTVDGNSTAATVVMFGNLSGQSTFTLTQGTVRATFKGGSSAAGAIWNLIFWDQNSTYQVDRAFMVDTTVAGPSSSVGDAFAISYVNVCQVTNLNFRGLARSPNFYICNFLFVDGLYSDGCPGTAAFAVDSGVNNAFMANVVVAPASNANVATVIVNAARVHGVNWDLGLSPNGSGIGVSLGLTGTLSSQIFKLSNSYIGAGFNFTIPMALLELDGVNILGSNGYGIKDVTPASSTSTVKWNGGSFDGTAFNFPWFTSTNAVNWSASTVQGVSVTRSGGITGTITWAGGSYIRGCPGYNPIGQVHAPGTACPASGTAIAAVVYDSVITIANGANALTAAITGGTTITYTVAANAVQSFTVPANQTLTPTYGGGAPTYAQQGL